MKKLILLSVIALGLTTSCNSQSSKTSDTSEEGIKELPNTVKIEGVAQNPEGIEFYKNDNTFLLSSLNAGPIIKVNPDGTYKPFTSSEPYPMSTAGLQIDYMNNRLLVAAFNGLELYDNDPATKGIANLRIYNLETGILEKDINLSSLIPDAPAYMANDIANDKKGNVYISDWFAGVVYKVDKKGEPSVFWKNETGIPSGANGIDFHPDGYLLVSLVSVNEKGLYANYGLVKIPIDDPKTAKVVIIDEGYTGFDGMVIKSNGNVVGVTNNGTAPGGNTLIELSSDNNWQSAK
jgi:sugar lactone lactonase YvrE